MSRGTRSVTFSEVVHNAHSGSLDEPRYARSCKHPLEEIQVAINDATSHEQAVKFHECLNHIDEFHLHKVNIEAEIIKLVLHT